MNKQAAAEFTTKFPARPGIFTINDKYLGGWRAARQEVVRSEQGPDGRGIEQKVGGPDWLAPQQRRSGRIALGAPRDRAGTALSLGIVTTFLTLIVVLPLAALVWESTKDGSHGFWAAISSPEAVAALEAHARRVARRRAAERRARHGHGVGARPRRLPGQERCVNAIIDLPFALPTIVAGLTLLALYGPRSPIGINVAYTRTAIVLALMFVTLPFVVRTVQPVLQELDSEMEDAAASLGASDATTFRRVDLPEHPARASSRVSRWRFAKAVGEFGSLVIITGNLPFKTEVSSVYIFGHIESGDTAGAAAVAIVLLVVSFGLLLSIGVIRHFTTRHDRA